MKFVHLSDLHLGKRINEFSMLEEQQYILGQILKIIKDEGPDAVLIAGDVYDKSVPSTEAVKLFDDFLVELAHLHHDVYIISGNHDSPERLSFASRLIDMSGIHFSPVYDGKVKAAEKSDEYGKVAIYMLPFVKPAHVGRYFEDEDIDSYTKAIEAAVSHMDIDESVRNVLITHQFVTGAERSESEEVSVGGTDNVDVSIFDPFDYVALGHLHRPQKVARECVRYCGTPLKYSFSEVNDEKSVTIIEMGRKGDVAIRTVPLVPKRDWHQIKGDYLTVMSKSFRDSLNPDDFYRIILTDEEDVPNAMAQLRTVYPYLMTLDYDNKRTRNNMLLTKAEEVDSKSPIELFGEFYEKQNGQPMTEEMAANVNDWIVKIWEDEQ